MANDLGFLKVLSKAHKKTKKRSLSEVLNEPKYELTLEDGTTFGKVGFNAYQAIKENRLDGYTPYSEDEKKVLDAFSEYSYKHSAWGVLEYGSKAYQDIEQKGTLDPYKRIKMSDENAIATLVVQDGDGKFVLIPRYLTSQKTSHPGDASVSKNTEEEAKEYFFRNNLNFGKFDSEEDAEAYAERMMYANNFYNNSRYKTSRNGNPTKINAFGHVSQSAFDDVEHDYINRDQDAIAEITREEVTNNAYLLGIDKGYLKEMKQDEIDIYNYIYNVFGADVGNEFIKDMSADLNLRRRVNEQNEWSAYAKKHPYTSSAWTVASSPLKIISAVGQVTDYADDGKIDQNAGYNKYVYQPKTVRTTVSDMIKDSWAGDVGAFAYNTGMSIGDSAVGAAMGGGTKFLSLGLMGTGAFADTVVSSKDKGLSDDQSIGLGIIAAGAEIFTENFSLNKLYGAKNAAKSVGKNAITSTRKYIVDNIKTNALEEMGADVINFAADVIIAKDKSEWQQSINAYKKAGNSEGKAWALAFRDEAIQIGLSGLAGALSGATMSAGPAVYVNSQIKSVGKANSNNVSSIIEQGLGYEKNTEAYKNAVKLSESDKTLSDYDVGRQILLNHSQDVNVAISKGLKQDKKSEAYKNARKLLKSDSISSEDLAHQIRLNNGETIVDASATTEALLSVNVGETFVDSNSNNIIKVTGRDETATTVEITRPNGKKEIKRLPNKTADTLTVDDRYVDVETSANPKVETVGAQSSVEAKTPSVSNEATRDSAEATAPIVDETDAEVTGIVDAISETIIPEKQDAFINLLKSRGFRGDVVTLAKALRKSYKTRGNIGVMADYFTDKGARVISAIEGTMVATETTTSEAARNEVNKNATEYTHIYDETKVSEEFLNSVNKEIENAIINIRNGNLDGVPDVIEVASLTPETIKKISEFVGFDISGYKCRIEKDTLIHIERRHGINGEHDQSLSDPKDIARMGYVINHIDNIEWVKDENGNIVRSKKYNNKNNTSCPVMSLSARVDGTYSVSQVVPDANRKTIWVTSARIEKADGGSQVPNGSETTPQPTPKAPLVSSSASNNIITHGNNIVNNYDMQNEENDASTKVARAETNDSNQKSKQETQTKELKNYTKNDTIEVTDSTEETAKESGKAQKEGIAYTNDNQEIKFKYKVVAIDDLVVSNDIEGRVNPEYPAELQPRDRQRNASVSQVMDIAKNLNPARMAESSSVSDGAPIVGPDNVVESGNGRTMALAMAYDRFTDKAEEYKQYLAEHADEFGIDADTMPEKPVLVRERITDVDRAEFARVANESNVATHNSTDQAKIDAERITEKAFDLLKYNEDGEINLFSRDNKPFIEEMIANVFGKNDLNNLVTAEGMLSANGVSRVENALFYKAYGDTVLTSLLSERTDNPMRNIVKALLNVSPRVALISNGIKQGVYYDFDFSEDIVSAAKLLYNLKEEGTKLDAYIAQQSLFEEEKYEVKAIATYFDDNKRSAKKCTEFLNEIMKEVQDEGNPDQISLFGEKVQTTKGDILDGIIRRRNQHAIEEEYRKSQTVDNSNGPGRPDVTVRKGDGQGEKGSNGAGVKTTEQSSKRGKSKEAVATISYSLEEYWHPDLSKKNLEVLNQIIKRDIQTSTRSITDTANWLLTRIGGVGVFAIYSTENTANPTLLYESKGKKAEVERNILLDLLEDEENGKSINGKPSFTQRVSQGSWMQNVNNSQNNLRRMGRGGNNQNAGVLQRQSKGNPSPAFRNVLENLFRIQEGARRGNLDNSNYSIESEDNYGEGRNLLSDGSGKRKNGKSSGKQTQRVDGRSRRYKEGRKTAYERREYCKTLKTSGAIERRIVYGHQCEVIPEQHYNDRMRKIVDQNSRNGIDETVVITGTAKVPYIKDSGGKAKTAKGIFIETKDGRKIVVVQYDNQYFTPEQINDHELVHDDYESERTQKVKNIIFNTLPKKVKKELLGVIEEDYSGILTNMEEDALEELVANVLSEMHYLSDSFHELTKAYWAGDDAFIARWEYETSKQSFKNDVENGFQESMQKFNERFAYEESVQLQEYIMSVNHSSDVLKEVDCKEIGNNIYVWKNISKTEYDIERKVSLENGEMAKFIRKEVENGSYRKTEEVRKMLSELNDGYGSDDSSGYDAENGRANSTDVRVSTEQRASDRYRNSKRSAQVKSVDTVKYSLEGDDIPDFLDLWNEHIEEYGAIPKGEKPARDISVPKKISEDEPVSYFARTMMEAGVTPDEALSEFEQAILDGTMSHEVIMNKNALNYAQSEIKKLGFDDAMKKWEVLFESEKIGKHELALGMELYNQCVNNKDYKNAMKIAAELAAEATRAGQTLQACRLLKLMSPDGQLYYLEKSVAKMNEEFKEKLGKKFEDIELDEGLMEEFYKAEDQESRDAAYDKICQNIADQIPTTILDKWNAWRYLAMLGNPRTHIRNIVGNMVFVPAIRIKNYIGAIGESIAKVDTAERTKSFTKSKEAVGFAEKDFEEMVKVLQGVNAKYAVTSDIEGKRTIFKTKWLEKLRLKNFDFLEMEDMWFLKMHYVDALARIITARELDVNAIDRDTLDKVRAYAVKEAQAATYRDANALAEGLNRLQRKAEMSNNKAVRATGALVEGVMPFKKTPLNIAKQGVQYSPVSILTGVYQATKGVKDGTHTATEAIDTLSKGLTGTGLLLLGYFLAAMGILVGEEEEPDKKKKYDKALGEQSYALKIGGKSYTIDWAAPLNLALFTGSALYDVTKDGEFTFKKVVDSLATLPEPLLELSVFSGISDTIRSAQYEKTNPVTPIVTNMATNYFTQAFPTIGGQISRILDPTKRNYYYEDKNSDIPGGLQSVIGKAASKIPFASRLFEPSVDVWGRVETYGGVVERTTENFVSPGYYSEENYTAVDKKLQALYEKTGETDILPRTQQKYFTADGVRYDMTAEQYTEAKILRGKKSFELVRKLIYSSSYNKMTDEEKIKAIKKCYDEAGDYTKEKMLDKVKRNARN